MSRRFANSSELEQRLKDLDRQLREVQRNLRMAEKGRLPAAPQPAAPVLHRASLPQAPAEPAAPAPPADQAYRRPAAPVATMVPAAPGVSDPLEDKRRFANYFSGNIIAPRPLKQQRRKMRNRAMFMLAVLILATFLVLRMIFP